MRTRVERSGRRRAARSVLVTSLLAALAAVSTAGIALPTRPIALPDPREGDAPPTWLPPGDHGCVRRTLVALDLPQRIGQLFIAGVDGAVPSHAQLSMITHYRLGGVILMGESTGGVRATRAVTKLINAQATTTGGVRLWIAVDQEGGAIQRLTGPGFSTMPSARRQGRLAASALERMARAWGTELWNAGANLNLAPVLDTVPPHMERGNRPIGRFGRQYGETPRQITDSGMAFVRGMRAAGVQTSAKHFPGLGRVRGNTDFEADVVDPVTTRDDAALEPFRALTGGGAAGEAPGGDANREDGEDARGEGGAGAGRVDMIMVSSARYPRIDPANPAVFSPTVLRGMIREDLRYRGVVVSDDLGLAAAVRAMPPGERAVRFLAAGGDVVLTVKHTAIPAMVAAVSRRAVADPAFRALVDRAAERVLTAKNAAGLLPCARG